MTERGQVVRSTSVQPLGLGPNAEDELLAPVVRGIREAAESRLTPIMRVVGEGDGVSDDLRGRGLPANHQRVSRHDWRHGLARCHACRRAVDMNADTLRLHSTGAPHSDDVVVFECPRCDKTTHFHIEVAT
jgi:hypothetical protein